MQLPSFSNRFSDNLNLLPGLDTVVSIELLDQSGGQVGTIENKPGQAGSLRVYCWLAETFGSITPEAAALGLKIYAEHTLDARTNPGKHPNIDRLFSIGTPDQGLRVRAV